MTEEQQSPFQTEKKSIFFHKVRKKLLQNKFVSKKVIFSGGKVKHYHEKQIIMPKKSQV
jgi:hypothetical protein